MIICLRPENGTSSILGHAVNVTSYLCPKMRCGQTFGENVSMHTIDIAESRSRMMDTRTHGRTTYKNNASGTTQWWQRYKKETDEYEKSKKTVIHEGIPEVT